MPSCADDRYLIKEYWVVLTVAATLAILFIPDNGVDECWKHKYDEKQSETYYNEILTDSEMTCSFSIVQ